MEPRRLLPVAGLGARVAVRVLGSGPAIVVLHGGGPGCSAETDFGALAADLAVGRQVVLLDLPRYGASDFPPIVGPVFDFHADVVAAVLDELGLARVDVVGQSLGGSVGLDLAARHPGRVRRIVATSSQPVAHPTSDPTIGWRARARLYGGAGPTVAKMRRLIARLEWWDPDAVPETTVLARFANSSRPEAIASVASPDGHGTAQDLADLLPQVHAPALIVFGRHDPFAPPAYAEHVASLLPDGRAHIVDETAHHPQEERPREYLRLVREFLEP